MRASLKKRLWHIPFCALVAAVLFGLAEVIYFDKTGHLPRLRNIWYLVIILPYLAGAATTLLAGGMVRWKRIISATISGVLTGGFYAIITIFTAQSQNIELTSGELVSCFAWRMFPFAVISTLAAIITELKLGDPDLK
jgi:ABC-type Co2+ transport system permease subunit